MPNITAIRVSSTGDDKQVVVLLDDAIRYQSARIGSPERIYFDLYGTHLRPADSAPITGDLPKWVRLAQNRDDVVRLVLDAEGVKDYSAKLLSSPNRLVIEAHGQPTGLLKDGMGADAGQHDAANDLKTSASHTSRSSLTRELGLKINRIAIDPGHGGEDIGATGPQGLEEKNLCLDVALRLGRLIEENMAGTEIVYTRTEDKYVSLEERTAIANTSQADLFISIHANSSDSRQVRGVETYYLSLATSPESMKLATRENVTGQSSLHDLPKLIQLITRNEKLSESRQLAGDIQNALSRRLKLVSEGETNRGVKRAPFVVLTGASMPAVLSEISFLSNASDEKLLVETSQRERVAEGLYLGVVAYLHSMNSLPNRNGRAISENHVLSGLEQSTAAIWQTPIRLLTGEN